MGTCYGVELKIKVSDNDRAVAILQDIINHADTLNINFNLERNLDRNITTNTLDDLINLFLSGCDDEPQPVEHVSGTIQYMNDFNASYGWEGVMQKMFMSLAEVLENDSALYIYAEDDDYTLVVKDHKVQDIDGYCIVK